MIAGCSGPEPFSYSRQERRADGLLHALGLLMVLAGTVLLLAMGLRRQGLSGLSVLLPYLLGLSASFAASAAYNLARPGRVRQRLRCLDHAAIYLLIAGTYTPVMALTLDRSISLPLLAAVWLGAGLGVALKLLAPGRHERLGLALYLLLGWLGLLAIQPLLSAMSASQLMLLGLGALLYTAGVGFHLAHRLPFHNAIWHGVVLAASTAHYVLVLDLVLAADGI